MARGINKCIFIGNLGDDPMVRYSSNGDAIANMSLAVGHTWKDKDGVKQEKTEWIKIVAFKRLAEIAGEFMKKGSQIYVEGRFTTRKWDDKEGITRYSTEIIASSLQMLGNRDSAPESQKSVPSTGSAQAGGDDFSDDPF